MSKPASAAKWEDKRSLRRCALCAHSNIANLDCWQSAQMMLINPGSDAPHLIARTQLRPWSGYTSAADLMLVEMQMTTVRVNPVSSCQTIAGRSARPKQWQYVNRNLRRVDAIVPFFSWSFTQGTKDPFPLGGQRRTEWIKQHLHILRSPNSR